MRFRESMVLLATLILVAFPMAADKSVTLTKFSCTSTSTTSADLDCTWKGSGCTVRHRASQSGYCVDNRCTEFTDFEGCKNRWCHRINAHAKDDCSKVIDRVSIVRLCPKEAKPDPTCDETFFPCEV
jgi:hypothetical protein